ncbi:MAG TPA: hypothetical protein PLH94_13010 [Fimbriimonadaceae bacterium]|nr:hypothetical protein [Fimbriimonadaceae bacterium]
MSFCLGITVREGLVAIADTRIISGNEVVVARKMRTFNLGTMSFFVLCSGLRSVSDKVLTYFEERLLGLEGPYDRLFKVVNALAEHIRDVAREDRLALIEGGLQFNTHLLVGGQCASDRAHHLYLVYPEGNWVEVSEESPYQIIGSPGYGKPLLDRTLEFDDPMKFAFKVGCLAFDSTRVSAADVDFPIDVALYPRDSFHVVAHRFQEADMHKVTHWWQSRLRQSVNGLPSQWLEALFEQVAPERMPT